MVLRRADAISSATVGGAMPSVPPLSFIPRRMLWPHNSDHCGFRLSEPLGRVCRSLCMCSAPLCTCLASKDVERRVVK